MAANRTSNGDSFEEKEGKAVYTPNDDNTTGNGNGDVVITPTKETGCISTSSTKRTRGSKIFPKEWTENWEVKEKLRSDGSKIEKSYRHKKEGFTCRSFKAVEDYEKYGTLPKRKRKEKEIINVKEEVKEKEIVNVKEDVEEELSKKKKEEAELNRIRVEKFLADAHYNLLHWFD
ncbi:uncharacterized protein LOC131656700 [Vicia villosa]|uniref:uncharacterized protein LOC131656700 n=1 Tax=Vicia villosa TaxID=3911 RepID=UPI00273BE635|nr:uncharacterized protein LOC131656700 [Vicia villosa]